MAGFDIVACMGSLPVSRVSRAEFFRFIESHPDLRTELTAEGEMIVTAPAHSRTSKRNTSITVQLATWAAMNGAGDVYESSGGFDLPNGANRSPDASWVRRSRLAHLTKAEQESFLPLCPDFVVELKSKSVGMPALRAKMTEYMDNGAQLAWLIDPENRTVHIYRPNCPVEVLKDPSAVSADPELPGFVLDTAPVFAS